MGMRQSRQRDAVLAAVRATMEHPTAEWVFREAGRRAPGISLATVYRNLKQLVAAGLIREIHSEGTARFDGNTGRHYHIRCLGCGRVSDLPMSIDEGLEERAGRAVNYRILGHDVEIHGLCPACQGRANNDSDSQLVRRRLAASAPRGGRARQPRRARGTR